jgi:cupin fold WbuC family metalloprotein
LLIRLTRDQIGEAPPSLWVAERAAGFKAARASERRRSASILHEPGAIMNRALCFQMQDTYMQPHLHPSEEKAERIWALEGRLAVVAFSDEGAIADVVELRPDRLPGVEVPSFTWHTYFMLTEEVVTYETMEGVYEPATWKTFAPWAPTEGHPDVPGYARVQRRRLETTLGRAEGLTR